MWNIHTYCARSLGRHQSKQGRSKHSDQIRQRGSHHSMDDVEKRHKSHLAFTQSETLLWVYKLITS